MFCTILYLHFNTKFSKHFHSSVYLKLMEYVHEWRQWTTYLTLMVGWKWKHEPPPPPSAMRHNV